jgi:SAM-dependent methyltransferase
MLMVADAMKSQYDVYYKSGLYGRRYPSPNQTTMDIITSVTNNTSNILDFGCGNGRYSVPLLSHCQSLTAYDISDEALHLLQQRLATEKPEISQKCVVTSSLAEVANKGPYDVIACLFGVFSHIPSAEERHETLIKFNSLLKDDGKLVISVPNRFRRFYSEQFNNLLASKDPVDITYTRAGVSDKMPYFLYSPSSLRQHLAKAKFKVISTNSESLWQEATVTNNPELAKVDRAITRVLPASLGYGIIAVAAKQ